MHGVEELTCWLFSENINFASLSYQYEGDEDFVNMWSKYLSSRHEKIFTFKIDIYSKGTSCVFLNHADEFSFVPYLQRLVPEVERYLTVFFEVRVVVATFVSSLKTLIL